MPIIPDGAHNFVIKDSPLTEITINSTGPTGIDILFGASIPEAAHDSSARDPPPRCFPGTREQYIEDIIHWAHPAVGDAPLPTYWMKGLAGVGKSAVAQTCVEKLKRLRKLGAAFFFSIGRQSKNNNNLTKRGGQYRFFISLAYQLSTIYPDYRNILDAKICRDKSLVDKTLGAQFWDLIVEPLQELEESGKGVRKRIPVFVDGLDECESREAQREIIEIVAAAALDGVAPLCWAFLSRPEPHIEAAFSKAEISLLCQKVALPISRDADGDIELYLRVGFGDILRRLNITTESPWPSDADMKLLVNAAAGLFTYAATVLRFVGQPDSLDPETLLRAILAVVSSVSRRGAIPKFPFAELDAFYMLILERIPDKMFPSIHLVLAILSHQKTRGALYLANMIELSKFQLEAICNRMAAVICFQPQDKTLELDPAIDTSRSFTEIKNVIPGEIYGDVSHLVGGSISFYHKSFWDFLRDPGRSGRYCINSDSMVKTLLHYKLKYRRDYEQGYRWEGTELVRVHGMPNSTSRFSYPYQNELTNSLLDALIYSSADGAELDFRTDIDHRKFLYAGTCLAKARIDGELVVKPDFLYQGCGASNWTHGRTSLGWFLPGEFQKFDIRAFKKRVAERVEAGVIQPYCPATSEFDPLNFEKGIWVDSGLYLVGHGSNSIIWYWVIDYQSKSFREFKTMDLAEGVHLYRVEDFTNLHNGGRKVNSEE